MNRYSRQTVLPEIGLAGQARLSASRILCVGVGGLGSPASLYLAAAGVGTIGLIDPDRVNLSNLQRQILFQNSDQGIQKVEAAKVRLLGLNPDITIKTFDEALDPLNAVSILSNYDLVIDGSDNFETKFLVNDASYKTGIPMIYGAVSHFEGQLALIDGVRGACYRCLYPTPPKAQVQNCAEAGVLGAVVGTIGTLQATLALQFLISGGDPTHPLFPSFGELTLFDLRGKWNIRTLQISKDPNCPTCSRAPNEVELNFLPQLCSNIQNIDAQTLATLLKTQSDAVQSKILLLDVREEEEWNFGHIYAATHWPLSRLKKGQFPAGPQTYSKIIIYCRSGQRSIVAAQLLSQEGLISIFNLTGGIESWPEKLLQ